MSKNYKQYLRIVEYSAFWAVDYNGSSLGCTVKTGTKDEMKAEYSRLCSLSDDQLYVAIFK